MAIFTLQITDNNETVDFLDSTNYKVMDGGFNISTPRNSRQLVPIREGFYLPIRTPTEYREATIKFSIHGASRSACLTALQKISRIIHNIHKRERPTMGARGQLSYAWDGATNITYFELFGADYVIQPADILSVEKIHRRIGSDYVIPDLELKLFLSAQGYGLSIYSDSVTELQLSTAVESAKTGGVTITNDSNDTGQTPWAQIASTQVPGGDPYILKLRLSTGSTYSWWRFLYIGLTETFPSTTIFDCYDRDESSGGTLVSSAGSNPDSTETYNYYLRHDVTADTDIIDGFVKSGWYLPDISGVFLPLLRSSTNAQSLSASWRIALEGDATTWGTNWYSDWVTQSTSQSLVPLPPITLPPGNPDLLSIAGSTLETLLLGIGFAGRAIGTPYSVAWDYLQLLPITGGLRILSNPAASTASPAGYFMDDYWKGMHYFISNSGSEISAIFPLMSPLFLQPNVTQRLYFHSQGGETFANERNRKFVVRAYGVPTYEVLAE